MQGAQPPAWVTLPVVTGCCGENTPWDGSAAMASLLFQPAPSRCGTFTWRLKRRVLLATRTSAWVPGGLGSEVVFSRGMMQTAARSYAHVFGSGCFAL